MENLLDAIKNNDTEAVENLLRCGLRPDFIKKYNVNDSGTKKSLLDYALYSNNINILKLLLDNGGRKYINYKNTWGKGTILHRAVACGNLEIIRLLLDYGAYTEARDKDGKTPLFHVSYPEAEDEFKEAEVYSEVVDLLFEYGADINAIDNYGNTPIMDLLQNPFYTNGMSEKLFNEGADIDIANNNGENALMFCFKKETDEFIDPSGLVKQAAKKTINAQDVDGRTPLIYAVIDSINNSNAYDAGVVDFIGELIKKGADINIKDNEGNTAFSYLIKGYEENNKRNKEYHNRVLFEIANELIKGGLSFEDIYNNAGIDFINGMAKECSMEAFAYLRSINGIQNNTYTELLQNLLYKDNYVDIFNKLIELGFDVNIRNSKGETPLMIASKYYNGIDIINIMLQNGADINAIDNNGYNALLHAINKDEENIIQFLFSHGAKIDLNNENIRKILLKGLFNKEYGLSIFLQKNNSIFNSVLNSIDFDNTETKQDVYRFLLTYSLPINDINEITNTNKNSLIRAIRIAITNFGRTDNLPFYNANAPMKIFIDFGMIVAKLNLTEEEKNNLNNMATKFDNAIISKNQQEVDNSIKELVALCEQSENIYKTINSIIDENLIYQKNNNGFYINQNPIYYLTKLLNYYGFNTKEISEQIKINEFFKENGISSTIQNSIKKSIINKCFDLIYKTEQNDDIYVLSQNLDINKACLLYQRWKTEGNKRYLINIISNNINNEETKKILINHLTNKLKINNKDLNIATLINLTTNSSLGKDLFTRLRKDLNQQQNLNDLEDINNALNNNQNQL